MKELLENYLVYKSNIKSKEYEIQRLKLEEASPSTSNLSINADIRGKGYVSSGNENKVISNADRIGLLQLEINELKAKIEMIDSMLDTLDDYHKRIIELKYKYNKTSIQIATILYRTKRAINKELKICLLELNEKYEKRPEKFPVSSH